MPHLSNMLTEQLLFISVILQQPVQLYQFHPCLLPLFPGSGTERRHPHFESRLQSSDWLGCFPNEWNSHLISTTTGLYESVKSFWDMGRHSEAWNQAIDTVTMNINVFVFLVSLRPICYSRRKNELDGTFVQLHPSYSDSFLPAPPQFVFLLHSSISTEAVSLLLRLWM